MKHRFSKIASRWYIPVLALVVTVLPVRAFSELQSKPDDSEETIVVSSFGRAEGEVGNVMKTSFMEFKVNDAVIADQYQSLTPDAGMKLLVLNISTHATQANPLVLYDTDYQIQWSGAGDLDYSEPVTYRDEWADFTGYKYSFDPGSLDGVFPGTGVLASDETVTYDYVYQVPEDLSEFRLLFQEYFEDESIGDFFAVTIHPQNAGTIENHLGAVEPLSGEGEAALGAEAGTEEAPAEGETVQAG